MHVACQRNNLHFMYVLLQNYCKVNVRDGYGLLPAFYTIGWQYDVLRVLLYNHVKKLFAVHQPLCSENVEFMLTPPRPLHAQYALYDNAADSLRHHRLAENISLFSVLQMDDNELSTICYDHRFTHLITQQACRSLSPVYGALIYRRIASGMRRRMLINETMHLIWDGSKLLLPLECMEHIFKHLSNFDLCIILSSM